MKAELLSNVRTFVTRALSTVCGWAVEGPTGTVSIVSRCFPVAIDRYHQFPRLRQGMSIVHRGRPYGSLFVSELYRRGLRARRNLPYSLLPKARVNRFGETDKLYEPWV
jgi:hypothetical protein